MPGKLVVVLLLGALFAGACGGDRDTPSTSPTTTLRPSEPASTPTGPRAEADPRSGPPGIQVTVRGSGWEPGVLLDVTGELAPGITADPYETVVTGADGSFMATFRLEAAPDGSDLSTGRYDIIARTTGTEVVIPFIVETRRPVGATGPNG